jgi:hypothetical protein
MWAGGLGGWGAAPQSSDFSGSSCEVNRLIDGFGGEGLPAIDLFVSLS